MADLTLNLGITNPIPLNLTVDQPQLNFTVAPIVVSFAVGGGSSGGGGGSVNSVTVASPLSTALTFANPTTNPALTIQNATPNANTKFLRGDGTWAVPAGAVAGVTSVALAAPAEFTVSGSPITSAGTITLAKANQNANLVFAGPASGAAAAPTFRSLVAADLPASAVVTRIIAGSNVTISPTTGVGAVTVSASGGGGGGGFSWNSPATIAVGDVVFASDYTNTNLAPGQTNIYDGSNVELREFIPVLLGLNVTSIGMTSPPVVLNGVTFWENAYTRDGLVYENAPLIAKQFSSGTYYSNGGANTILTSTDLINTTSVSANIPGYPTSGINVFSYASDVGVYVQAVQYNSNNNYQIFFTNTLANPSWVPVFNATNVSSQFLTVSAVKANGLLILIAGAFNSGTAQGTPGFAYSTTGGGSTSSFTVFTAGVTSGHSSFQITNIGSNIFAYGGGNTIARLNSSGITLLTQSFTASFGPIGSIGGATYGVWWSAVAIYYSLDTGNTFNTISSTTIGGNISAVEFANNSFYIWYSVNNVLTVKKTVDFVSFTTITSSLNGVFPQPYIFRNAQLTSFVPAGTISRGYVNLTTNNLITVSSERREIYLCANGTYRYLGGPAQTEEDGLWIRTA